MNYQRDHFSFKSKGKMYVYVSLINKDNDNYTTDKPTHVLEKNEEERDHRPRGLLKTYPIDLRICLPPFSEAYRHRMYLSNMLARCYPRAGMGEVSRDIYFPSVSLSNTIH